MFNEILEILKELDNSPFIIVHKVVEHLIENNDDIRLLKINIYKLYGNDFYSLIFKANVKENNPDNYLKQILDRLLVIKNKYFKVGVNND